MRERRLLGPAWGAVLIRLRSGFASAWALGLRGFERDPLGASCTARPRSGSPAVDLAGTPARARPSCFSDLARARGGVGGDRPGVHGRRPRSRSPPSRLNQRAGRAGPATAPSAASWRLRRRTEAAGRSSPGAGRRAPGTLVVAGLRFCPAPACAFVQERAGTAHAAEGHRPGWCALAGKTSRHEAPSASRNSPCRAVVGPGRNDRLPRCSAQARASGSAPAITAASTRLASARTAPAARASPASRVLPASAGRPRRAGPLHQPRTGLFRRRIVHVVVRGHVWARGPVPAAGSARFSSGWRNRPQRGRFAGLIDLIDLRH